MRATVRGLAKNATQVGLSGLVGLGDAAWIEVAGVHFILCSQRTQCFHPTAFTALGLDPTTLRSIVVKSTNHFRAGFDAIATDMVYVDSARRDPLRLRRHPLPALQGALLAEGGEPVGGDEPGRRQRAVDLVGLRRATRR